MTAGAERGERAEVGVPRHPLRALRTAVDVVPAEDLTDLDDAQPGPGHQRLAGPAGPTGSAPVDAGLTPGRRRSRGSGARAGGARLLRSTEFVNVIP